MHPRNLYKDNAPDFRSLAKLFPSFQPLQLTLCLLKRDFGLEIDFPLDTLCPPVPNRLNYILWLEDILAETTQADAETVISGIDIGVGASCIYPLLGCANNKNWRFVGTEIDKRSLEYAKKNVWRNKLSDRIRLIHNMDATKIFNFLESDDSRYAFSMCNPPFYESKEEIEEAYLSKDLAPSAVCMGTENEMITEGGEYGFLKRMIQESLIYKERIRWYTSLIGQKKSIKPLVRLLKYEKINNYVVTEFSQGRTKRWAIAWSFFPARAVTVKSLEFYRPKCRFVLIIPKSMDFADSQLDAIFQDLNVTTNVSRSNASISLRGEPLHNTWSRAARRQKKRQRVEEKIEDVADANSDPLFGFDVRLQPTESVNECEVMISWLNGEDRNVFESFWNHVKKRLQEACGIKTGSAFAA
ncbi:uncharacterized protein BYT42DRAFT_491363 [Radiomyces spectabilis]|uniref:uncharacterized protein n=1 Tax=Radiomyces spectabilis TaxID=64574 RepID=UPI00221EBFDC|nr:uncharacterized protein BYT42DRAFT_491363 [Radiomyces spectabilis]KAI8388739.1 hypothetical protein BYT42DRAFT_491363 [Radiomyces spectabilis]